METRKFEMLFYNASSGIELSMPFESSKDLERAKAILREMGLIDDGGTRGVQSQTKVEHVLVNDDQFAKFNLLLKHGKGP